MTVSQAEFDSLKADVAEIKKLISFDYLTGPQLVGATYDEKKADFFNRFKTLANEMANGDLSLGIGQKLTNFIDGDQRKDIDDLIDRVKQLEAKPAGAGIQGPKGDKGDKGDIGPQGLPGSSGSGTVTGVGVIPGFGYGLHLVAGTFEALVFIQDAPDNALRILTNHKANGDGGFTHANKKLGQQRIDIEQFGVGISYWTPLENADGTPFPRNTLDKKGGKGVIIRNHSDDNHRAPYAQIYTGLPGQGLQVGVSRNTPNVMDQPTIQIEPDGTKSIG